MAQAVEDAHLDDLDEQAALIAHHWGEAGRAVEAAGWHQRAAEWVTQRDPYQAAQQWRSVHRLLRDHADDPRSLDLRLQACMHLTMAAWRVGMAPEEVAELFEEGKRLAERADDSRMLALITTAYAAWLTATGESRAGYERHREAHALVHRLSASDRVLVLLGLQVSSYATGRLQDAVRLLHELLEIAGDDATLGMDTVGFSILCYAAYGFAVQGWLCGRLAEAWRESDRALALARAHKQTDLLCWGLGLPAHLAHDTGSEDSQQLD